MRKYRNTPLTSEEIEVIERLVDKWDSERQIESITSHSRNTIRFYKHEYFERKRIAEKLEKAIDKYYWTPDVKIYTISFWFVWLVLFSIIFLSWFWIYFLINL